MTKKRVFIIFAIEDKKFRDLLSGQSKNPNSPFEFVDMSAKEPWDKDWKTNCRIRIKGCDGVIAFISKNTSKAEGALWEMKCAKEENIPLFGVYCYPDDRPSILPDILTGVKVIDWSWDGVARFIDSLR
ncbi:MAG TPA: hypothetical protein VF493_18795 [Terriglobales bacterium]